MASPPQPQPPMGPPGAAYGEAAASSLGMSYLQGQACDAATYAAVGPGVGMSAVGMGGMGGAPPWAPSSPQLVPHGHPPHGPSSGERGWLGYEYGLPHGHPTVQENPAGSSDIPVKLFVGTAARSGAPSWRRQSLGRWPATICTSCLHLMSAAPGGSGRLGTGQGVGERRRHRPSHYRGCSSQPPRKSPISAAPDHHPGSLPGGATTAAVQQIFQPFGQVSPNPNPNPNPSPNPNPNPKSNPNPNPNPNPGPNPSPSPNPNLRPDPRHPPDGTLG